MLCAADSISSSILSPSHLRSAPSRFKPFRVVKVASHPLKALSRHFCAAHTSGTWWVGGGGGVKRWGVGGASALGYEGASIMSNDHRPVQSVRHIHVVNHASTNCCTYRWLPSLRLQAYIHTRCTSTWREPVWSSGKALGW